MFFETRNLKKVFEDTVAVNNLSVYVNKGELLCLLGPSGCGKTTTLKMIGGFLAPNRGRIFIDGKDITDIPPEKRPVSTVFQSYALFPHMDVINNVIYGLKFRGVSKRNAIKMGEKYLDMVGLKKYKNKRIQELSGGQKQRIALVRSLITKPKILLLDEPLSNLDAKLRIKMREEIKNIQKEFNITMIFVTHDQEEALSIGDRIAIMNKGKLEQLGTPRQIYENPESLFVLDFIGSSNIIKDEDGRIKFVRPEMIKISKNNGRVKGIIEDKIFLGSYIIYKIEVKKHLLKVQVPNTKSEELNIGEKVYLSYDMKELGKGLLD